MYQQQTLTTPACWDDAAVLQLLQTHTYDEVRAQTGWSRGRIYAAACRHSARKTEGRIAARRREREEMQRQFLADAMGKTLTMDVLDFMGGLPDDCADLVVTSPPYNLGKRYGEHGHIDTMRFAYYYGFLVQCLSEMARTLKPGGTLCLQVGQTMDETSNLYPIDVLIFEDLRRCGLTYQTRVVWTFKHGLTPQRRLADRYETMLVFSKGEQQTFNANAARVPQLQPDKRAFKGPNKGKLSGHPFGAHPGSVWEIPNIGANNGEKTDHPCQFPAALARRAILLYSNAGATVLDPFHGSGTTHAECLRTGRGFIGADLHYADTRAQRLAKVYPDLVTALPGVTDESVAVWQAEARRVELAAKPIPLNEELDLFDALCA